MSITPAMLCEMCDSELGPDRYCPQCAEVMPVYPEPAEPFLHGYHPARIEAIRSIEALAVGLAGEIVERRAA